MVAERKTVSTRGLKPVRLPLTTSLDRQSEASTLASIPTAAAENLPSKSQLSGRARLECKWELPSLVAREIDRLSRRWAKELGEAPFDPDWSYIFACERSQSAAVWTARPLSGELVGYLAVGFKRGLFIDKKFARIEAGYLAPEWREGWSGYKFIKDGVDSIIELGGFTIEWETNVAYEQDRLVKLLERLKFKKVGTVMQR